MHARLLDLLVCPVCLPEEHPLQLQDHRHSGDDITSGTLVCPDCGAAYAITDGLADLVPPEKAVPTAQARYDTGRLSASYLWSHYADLWEDREATDAYTRWLEMAGDWEGPGLDAGCAVGRFTFEMAAKSGFAVGVDLSRPFVTLARRIARKKEMAFTAPRQGHLTTRFEFSLPARLQQGIAEFVRADVARLPFRAESFGFVASLNVVDKLPRPMLHLVEARRVCARKATVLLADPFSWSENVARPEDWLGGTAESGDSAAVVATMLGAGPGWEADIAGSAWWTIRDHVNRYERIRSEVIVAHRSAE
ncbi:Methyltransferase type 11 [Solidesulfovibrio fructosivorans JJ]]|uniref:Methyltransferase type 11 n=1 Tax=Solidesulfovibrio fructosivorans JJ] TaxID=596151 RepID=E1JZU8_SOLFR|nr:methyltransferase domain-containing protein [Solidesulfovibrio fructosivorans]EFL50128.1 Methyltransferase type 11 [Solidesulfovibrio fructosivorans JJ]]